MSCAFTVSRPSSLSRWVLLTAGLASGVGIPLGAQTPQTVSACYVPAVGAIYMIKLPGLPQNCLPPLSQDRCSCSTAARGYPRRRRREPAGLQGATSRVLTPIPPWRNCAAHNSRRRRLWMAKSSFFTRAATHGGRPDFPLAPPITVRSLDCRTTTTRSTSWQTVDVPSAVRSVSRATRSRDSVRRRRPVMRFAISKP